MQFASASGDTICNSRPASGDTICNSRPEMKMMSPETQFVHGTPRGGCKLQSLMRRELIGNGRPT
jgi:hypothetical protein